jgi:hypothetical protein
VTCRDRAGGERSGAGAQGAALPRGH